MKFKIGKTYNFAWPDGAIAEYIIDSFDYAGVMRFNIRFANGATNHFYINSPMYKNSYAK